MGSFRQQARLLFAGAWLIGLTMVISGGFVVDGYQLYVRKVPLPHPYPRGGVMLMCALITVETALFYALVAWRAQSLSWRRAVMALPVAFALLLFSGAAMMHQPPYVYRHGLWLIIVTLSLLCVLVLALLTRGLMPREMPRDAADMKARGERQ